MGLFSSSNYIFLQQIYIKHVSINASVLLEKSILDLCCFFFFNNMEEIMKSIEISLKLFKISDVTDSKKLKINL